MARQPRIVKQQKTRVIDTHQEFSSERSPYWDWVEAHGHRDANGEPVESVQANPDQLSTDSHSPFAQESGLSVGDITRQLSGQQRKIFEMYVQEGKNEEDIATVLKIAPGTVRTYLQRIRERFKFYV